MGHHTNVSQEHVQSLRWLSLWPVLRLWGVCGFPYCHTPISSDPHDASACTKHYLQESVGPHSKRTLCIFSPALSVRTEMRAGLVSEVPSWPWLATLLASAVLVV